MRRDGEASKKVGSAIALRLYLDISICICFQNWNAWKDFRQTASMSHFRIFKNRIKFCTSKQTVNLVKQDIFKFKTFSMLI